MSFRKCRYIIEILDFDILSAKVLQRNIETSDCCVLFPTFWLRRNIELQPRHTRNLTGLSPWRDCGASGVKSFGHSHNDMAVHFWLRCYRDIGLLRIVSKVLIRRNIELQQRYNRILSRSATPTFDFDVERNICGAYSIEIVYIWFIV